MLLINMSRSTYIIQPWYLQTAIFLLKYGWVSQKASGIRWNKHILDLILRAINFEKDQN